MTCSRKSLTEAIARAIAPRKPTTVSDWADRHRILSSKETPEPGQWRTSRTPLLKEPMDCMSSRSTVQDVVLMFPIQLGKTMVAINAIGYAMCEHPGPLMVCLPGEVSMHKWINQKLQPALEETGVMRQALTSTNSREAANRREFKDFAGGQLYIEHAGSPSRLKSTSVRTLVVDELDEFAANLHGGDDPVDMLNGRTSAFRATYKRLYISTPQVQGISRTEWLWNKSDQRQFHVPCPHCDHMQPLVWGGLHWTPNGERCWYVCSDCGALIHEHEKTAMIAAGKWIPKHPERKLRGYQTNALYYSIGLGPRWQDLVQMWLDAQGDPARIKTFVNDRLAEAWEDPAMRAVRHNVIADRAEPYKLRTVPAGGLVLTAGVDTQDNRLEVHIVAWGPGLAAWTVDYAVLHGDPADDDVWAALTDLLNRPIEHEHGGHLRVQATCIDAGGHRTEAVKNYARARLVRRPTVIFGAKPNNAPVLSRGKLQDVNWRGQYDKRGVMVHHVGTVAIKHLLYGRISTDAEKEQADRLVHVSDELPDEFFSGLVAETFNPAKNRFEHRRGSVRNEPLDTWVYAYAATHHPELRLHRYTKTDWEAARQRLVSGEPDPSPAQSADSQPQGTPSSTTGRLGGAKPFTGFGG